MGVATILEYNVWAFSMGQMCRERVCSSFAVNQTSGAPEKLESSQCYFSHLYRSLSKGKLSATEIVLASTFFLYQCFILAEGGVPLDFPSLIQFSPSNFADFTVYFVLVSHPSGIRYSIYLS